jgi:hypothetical protein
MIHVSTVERFTDTAAQDEDSYTFQRQFIVKMSGTQQPDDPLRAVTAPDIPGLGSSHPAGMGAIVLKRSAEHLGDAPDAFLVSVDYGKKDDDNSSGSGDKDDKDKDLQPTLSLQSETVSDSTRRDTFFVPLAASNGIPFAAPYEFDRERLNLAISARVPFNTIRAMDWDYARGLVHGPLWQRRFIQNGAGGIEHKAIRQANRIPKFLGFPAFRPKFKNFGARTTQEHDREGGVDTVWDINLTFSIDFWLGAVLDEGFYTGPGEAFSEGQLGNVNPEELKRVLDLNGVPVSLPILLDGNGAALEKGAQPWYLVFQVHNHADLNVEILNKVGLPTKRDGYRFKDER